MSRLSGHGRVRCRGRRGRRLRWSAERCTADPGLEAVQRRLTGPCVTRRHSASIVSDYTGNRSVHRRIGSTQGRCLAGRCDRDVTSMVTTESDCYACRGDAAQCAAFRPGSCHDIVCSLHATSSTLDLVS